MSTTITFHNLAKYASKWFTGQIFMSALTNAPVVVDIYFDNNSIVRCCFYKGNFYNYRTFMATVNFFYSRRCSWYEMTAEQRKEFYSSDLVKLLIESRVLKVVKKEHKYHKNIFAESIEIGPLWDSFLKQIKGQEEVPLYFIEDVKDEVDE